MKNLIYAVKDIKIGSFLKPFICEGNVQAERIFQSAVNDDKTQLHQYPEDFQLWLIAQFDDESGQYKNMTPALVSDGMRVYKEPTNPFGNQTAMEFAKTRAAELMEDKKDGKK